MKKIKKPISVLLAMMMVVSLFAIVPFTAGAENNQIPEFLLPYADGGKILSPGNSICGKDENNQDILFDVVYDGKDYADTYIIAVNTNNSLNIYYNTHFVQPVRPTSDTSYWFAEYKDSKLYLSLGYTINSNADWQSFCNTLNNNDEGYFTGKTVKLGADINITEMAGSKDHPFTGTFDGQGHTLTVALNNNSTYTAPFRYVGNCSIRDLHIKGTIDVSGEKAAGIAAYVAGNVTISNCRSSVVISSSYNGTATDGGIVGQVLSGSLSIQGCVFDGKILAGNNTKYCCGFVGYKNKNTSLSITDSIYAPAAIESDEVEVSNNCFTFVRNGSVGTNCYYTRTLGTAQGKAARTITAGQDVTIDYGTATETYSVSGITAYEKGLAYNGTFYAGKDDEVALTLGYNGTLEEGYTHSGYTASAGTLGGTENPYTLTMPDEDVTVSAALTPDPAHFSQDGDTYTIHTATGWDIFCDLIEEGETFSGKTVVLGDDISVTRMAGSRTNSFKGTFDGQEHTINANISGNTGGEAVFSGIDGATIRNLTLSGSITGGQHCGALVGFASGTNTIENVNVTADVSLADSIAANKAHHGGVIGHALSSNTTLRGVVYSGTISSKDFYSDIVNVGGLVGWADDATIKIENSVFDGTYSGGTLFHPILCKTGNKTVTGTFTNVYYTVAPTANNSKYYLAEAGKAAHTVTAGKNVTIDYGTATETYSVSGITAYEKGLAYNGTFYAGKDDEVALTLGYNGTPEEGYTHSGYTASSETLDGTENPYTLTMPAENVTVSAEFTFSDGVGARLVGHSLSLHGDIGVNFYMELDPEIAASDTAYMLFTIPNGDNPYTAKVYVNEQSDATLPHAEKNGNYYVFKCNVAAKEMTSIITARIYDGETPLGTEYNYSVEEYANYLLDHTADNAEYAKAAPLVEKMLSYGAHAKDYFDKTVTLNDLADLTIDEKFATFENSLPDNLYDGATLSLKSQTSLSLYFTDTDELTFTCVDEKSVVRTVETVRNGSTQIARIRNIAASELQNNFTVTVTKGETVLGTITYSPMNYAYKVLNGGTDNNSLKNVIKALYLYSQAANEYFG